MIEFGIRMDGKDIARLRGKVARCAGYIQKEARTALKESAELYYLILIEHIGETMGDEWVFPDTYWPKLSKKWLDIKRTHGWTEEIWEAAGQVRGAIRVYGVETKGTTISIYVGLKDVSAGILMKAMENEFGASGFSMRGLGISIHNVPARPLFEPAKRELLRGTHKAEILRAFQNALHAALGNFK